MDKDRIESIARICHESIRALKEIQGDHGLLPWRLSPEHVRAQIIADIKLIIEEPALTAEELHRDWLAAQRASGWTFGHVQDNLHRLSPNVLPWKELSRETRRTYELKIAVTKTML
jgi:hypothetical protein